VHTSPSNRTKNQIMCRSGCIAGVDVHINFSASRPQNVAPLFFMHGWAQCSFHKKRVETHYAKLVFLHPVVSMGDSAFRCIRVMKHRRTIIHARVEPVGNPQKAHRDMLCQTCGFASDGICRSRSAFWCV
jgi:hypothetical protein